MNTTNLSRAIFSICMATIFLLAAEHVLEADIDVTFIIGIMLYVLTALFYSLFDRR